MALFPHGAAWSNLQRGVDRASHVGRYFWNTVVLAFGSWLVQIVVATTGGFALSVLRPRYARVIIGALLLTTLFVPAVVLLVPLYIEIVHPPLDPPLVHRQLLGDLAACRRERVQRHPREALLRQPAARDLRGGARSTAPGRSGCSSSIVLPMSKPILGVVSVFAVLASWKDFLWPLLVLTNPDKQPLSVRLPTIQSQTELGVFLAAMFIACLVPIVGFLIFQRSFLAGHRPRRSDQGLTADDGCD